jgi:uncharacterized protein
VTASDRSPQVAGEPECLPGLPQPGDTVSIVKLRPDGTEGTRYPGTVLPGRPGWLVAHAVWGRDRLDLGYLVFEPEDYFIEYFALHDPFNVFALYSDQGELKGWYCNVTHPTRVASNEVAWHDLYLDVIVYPDGQLLLLDEDELAEAGVEQSDPSLFAVILDGSRKLQALARERAYPFCDDHSGLF